MEDVISPKKFPRVAVHRDFSSLSGEPLAAFGLCLAQRRVLLVAVSTQDPGFSQEIGKPGTLL